MQIEVGYRVEVEPQPIVENLRAVGEEPGPRTPHLQELQDALVADPDRFRRFAELLAWRAVGEYFAKDLHECVSYGIDAKLTEILRPVADGLSEEARAWLVPALSHWSWLSQSDDGATFQTAFTHRVSGPEEPYLEPTERDYEVLSHYSYGGEPVDAASFGPKPKGKGKSRTKKKA